MLAFASTLPRASRHFFALPLRCVCRPFSVFIRMGDGAAATVPREKLQTAFSRSSGPGGQNTNKVNTKAEIRFALAEADWLDPAVRERFLALFGGFVNSEGEVYIASQAHRTQEANLREAVEKLTAMVRTAATPPKIRHQRTALSELTKNKYIEDKRRRSALKDKRKGPAFEE
jgi:protein subunit release factor B